MTPKPRYGMLHERIGPDWLSFTVTASDQVHVDVAEPEVVAMTNLGNILAPVVIALCGNSSMLAGQDAGCCSWREAGMGAIDAARGRHGMPHMDVYLNVDTVVGRGRSCGSSCSCRRKQRQPSRGRNSMGYDSQVPPKRY